jgi:hypothetical protein
MAITSKKPLHDVYDSYSMAEDFKTKSAEKAEKAKAKAEHSAEYVMLEKIYEDLWD